MTVAASAVTYPDPVGFDVTVMEMAPANGFARASAIGEPQPVTGSHPVPAEYPFEPVVMSWNSLEYEPLLAIW